jgi:hypothetical protein
MLSSKAVQYLKTAVASNDVGNEIANAINAALPQIAIANANALTVGPNGTTNPTLNVNTATALAATGLDIVGAAAGGGLALSVITSGTNENLTLDAAGSGTITLNGIGTGAVIAGHGLTVPGGAEFLTTNTALTNGAGVGAGTLTTAPAAGNPTKWIGINDNGTLRYVPAW